MNTSSRRIIRGWMDLEVTKIDRDAHDALTLYIVNREANVRAFDYTAGQYLTFRFDAVSSKPIVRSYTMSSSPCQPEEIAVTVKETDLGFISHHLCRQIKVGDTLRARGPLGKFVYDPEQDHEHLVMIGAGSGVTPFVSIAREYAQRLGENLAPKRMTLLLAFRSKDDILCKATIESLTEAMSTTPNLRVLVTLSRDEGSHEGYHKGRITPDLIDLAVDGSYENTTFMTCGPEAMMSATVSHVLSKGVTIQHMKTESFG